MVQRLTYRRRLSYNTASNKTVVVKTPGGRLVYQYPGKVAGKVKCGDCGEALAGITQVRPAKRAASNKRNSTVTRAYGGSLCHSCLRKRIVRAFLIEEQKIVKRVVKSKGSSAAAPAAAPAAPAKDAKAKDAKAKDAGKKKEAGKKDAGKAAAPKAAKAAAKPKAK